MKKITNIILDFDGTLGDTASVIIQTMQATIQELNLPARSDEECAAMIGLRLIEIPAVLFPECGARPTWIRPDSMALSKLSRTSSGTVGEEIWIFSKFMSMRSLSPLINNR